MDHKGYNSSNTWDQYMKIYMMMLNQLGKKI